MPQTLLNVSGSGSTNTAQFTVGGSGDYDIYWSYQDTSGTGEGCVFDFFGDGGSDPNVTDPNVTGSGDSEVTHVYNDPGSHYIKVGSDCGTWTLKVVTAL